ncbi:hypothetical protein [Wielerella bovis]|nr:hypothetical protein [Wielerella bovis]
MFIVNPLYKIIGAYLTFVARNRQPENFSRYNTQAIFQAAY